MKDVERPVKTGVATPKSARSCWGDRRLAALLIMGSLVVLTLVNLPYLSTYAVKDDDTPVLYHSVRNFSPSPASWVTDGFSEYFRNYPEQENLDVDVIRPAHNLVIYLESWLISDPHSVGFVLANYLGHALVVGLVFRVARRIFRMPVAPSLLAAVLFSGTVSTGERPPQGSLENSVAYSSDMLGCLFALAALLVAHSHVTGPRRTWKVLVTVALLVVSVLTKETTLGAPVVVAIAVIAEGWPARATGTLTSKVHRAVASHRGFLAVLLLPLVLYVVVYRYAEAGGGYVFNQLFHIFHGIPLIVINPLAFFFMSFFPVELGVIDRVVTGSDGTQLSTARFAVSFARAGLAVAVNVLAWAAVVSVIRQARDRAWLVFMLLMALTASASPMLISARARYFYFGQALMLPLLVTVLMRIVQSPRWAARQRFVPAVIGILILIGPGYSVTRTVTGQDEQVALNREASMLREAAIDHLADPDLKRLYLVNAHGQNGLPELQLYATEQGRHDVQLRVINTVGGPSVTEAEDAGTWFTWQGDRLHARVRVGPDQVLFGGDIAITRENLDRLTKSQEVLYGEIGELAAGTVTGNVYVAQRDLEFSIPDADRFDYVVIGFDPAHPGIHVYEPGTGTWRPMGTSVGGS